VLASYPGLFTTSPPSDATSFGVYWPALVPDDVPRHEMVLGDIRTVINPVPVEQRVGGDRMETFRYSLAAADPSAGAEDRGQSLRWPDELLERQRQDERDDQNDDEPTTRIALGRVFGARSGDKGGNANIGVWARSDDAYLWLHRFLTVERLRELMPTETAGLAVARYELPNLRALNFVVVGLLGRGVAASTRSDPQAKGLGEYLRAKVVEIPSRLVDAAVEPHPSPRPPPPPP
jgi:hypothetical protein